MQEKLLERIDKLENRVTTLETRVTTLENILNGSHRSKPGRKPKLNHSQKNQIIQKSNQGISHRKLAKEYSVSATTISNILKGQAEDDMVLDIVRKK